MYKKDEIDKKCKIVNLNKIKHNAVSTVEKIESHNNPTVPCYRVDSEVPCSYGARQFVHNYLHFVIVSFKHL